MTLDLWEESPEDVRERWRDIARVMRETGDAEALPRALQTAFWFGADAAHRAGQTNRFDSTLRGLLPAVKLDQLRGRSGSAPPAPKPGPVKERRS